MVEARLEGTGELEAEFSRKLSEMPSHLLCVPQFFSMLKYDQMERYEECKATKLNTTDLSVAGAGIGIQAECWCQNNMTEFMQAYGCADHPNWKWLCQLTCSDDCTSRTVSTCLKKCPALCLDDRYELDGCECRKYDCYRHTQCIVEDSMSATAAGTRNHTCDGRAVTRSGAIAAYNTCRSDLPYRTTWDRQSSQSHCVCSGLQGKLQNSSCCEVNHGGFVNSTAAKSIFSQLCDLDCGVDCESAEAKNCTEECHRSCVEVDPEVATDACKELCLDNQSRCNKYKVCKPAVARSFDYVCDDGSRPDSRSGCCKSLQGFNTCPTWCNAEQLYIVESGGPQCVCGGCPAMRNETYRLMNMTFASALMRQGQRDLLLVAKAYGLPGPTQEMVNLLEQQNFEIEEAIKHHGSYWDMELQRQIYQISRAWRVKILAAAESARNSRNWTVEETGGRGLWLLLLLTCSIACVCGLAVWILLMKLLQAPAHSEVTQPDPGSLEEKPNVVVGRPVAHEPDVENVSAGVVAGVLLGRTSGAQSVNSRKATE
eukprot:TRINITY_DN30980_c0_g1_i1.p1 TRINITY_DN30980_c0_g1~~TRINITY_DN30980_c0_g1_i1.p1  ORF type:complete len:584 (-),score=86.96 TRINITY_DN30980_c0_g1_i1:44-1666(-)